MTIFGAVVIASVIMTSCGDNKSKELNEDSPSENIIETNSNNDGNITQPNSTSDQTNSENRESNDEELIKLVRTLRIKGLNEEKIIYSLQNDGHKLSDITSAMDSEKERWEMEKEKRVKELSEKLIEFKKEWNNEENSEGGD